MPGIEEEPGQWTTGDSLRTMAVVSLLIDHGYWLRRPDFEAAAVGQGRIGWKQAREYADRLLIAATGQRAILEVTLELGPGRFRPGITGCAHPGIIRHAMTTAFGASG